ncbi:MAG: peptidoglycan-binding domain-containing protein [Actinomycetota bacterium]
MPITTPAPTTPDTQDLERPGRSRPASTAPAPAPDSPRPSRRPVIVGLATLAVAAVIAAAVLGSSDDGDGTGAEPVTLRGFAAEQRDLAETTEISGTLAFADVTMVNAGADGTITAIVDDGATLVRGDVLYEVNAQPVTIFYGDIPFYRPLTPGTEGDDVLLLEQNLASLGYHATEDDDGEEVDDGFLVDGVFDAATTDAVRRWQADLGVEETGTVDPTTVVMVPGPTTASAVDLETGDRVQVGTPIATLNVTGTESAVYAAHTGEVELEVTSGDVASGQVLYTVDDRPVLAVVTAETMVRDLGEGVEDGDDVAVLEQLLVDLGYDADGDLEVDDVFDEFTTEALTDFEEDLQDTWDDIVVDGEFTTDEFIVLAPGARIDTVTPRESTNVAGGSELFTYGSEGETRIVTTSIEVADQDKLAEGAMVDVEFPDGSVVTGTVAEVATSSTTDPTNPTAEPTLAVEIALDDVPESAAGLNELDVDVVIVDDLAAGATVVPASALVATADGGFAVEVVTGSTTTFVAVDPGMFADGFVEVAGIDPGTVVVVPA